jgi:alkanesulfonate monooxygenase SsuD/methylene tetrahydromethanopterin reductase-like flavin-dependent oxidoreductase (luciferase family)
MSGSSPDAAALAARLRVGVGFAATPLTQAVESAGLYRAAAEKCGWEPSREQVLYRIPVHIGTTDAEARDTLDPEAFIVGQPKPAAANALRASSYRTASVAQSRPRGEMSIETRIESGQLLIGSPDTLMCQIERLQVALRPGVLDLHFPDLGRDALLHALELFGTRVLPRIQSLE